MWSQNKPRNMHTAGADSRVRHTFDKISRRLVEKNLPTKAN